MKAPGGRKHHLLSPPHIPCKHHHHPNNHPPPPPPNTVPLKGFLKSSLSPSCGLGVKTHSVWCGLCLWEVLKDILQQILDTHLQRAKQGNTAKLSGHTSSTGDCCNPRDKPKNVSEPYRNWIPICTPTKRKLLRVQALANTTFLSSSGTIAQWQSYRIRT